MSFTQFADKVAIVTGAASGLGFALSKRLADSGSRVICIDTCQHTLSLLLKELGNKAEGIAVDVTNFRDLNKAIGDIAATHGKIDYFFNNASTLSIGAAKDISIEDWNEILSVNLHGAVNATASIYPLMIQQKSGHIVNISSLNGIIPAMMLAPYVTSKYGVIGLSHALRMEAKWLGIKVSAACPNLLNTPIWIHSKITATDAERADEFLHLSAWPQRLMDVDLAAQLILKGTLKNKATILNDTLSHFLWMIYRISPTFWMWAYNHLMRHRLAYFKKYQKP